MPPAGSPSDRGETGRPDPAQRFARLDANGDGKLQADEMPDRMKPLLNTADSNGDGALDRAEMQAAMQRFRGGGGARPPGGSP